MILSELMIRLYYMGKWSLPTTSYTVTQQEQVWEEIRNALNLPKGSSPR